MSICGQRKRGADTQSNTNRRWQRKHNDELMAGHRGLRHTPWDYRGCKLQVGTLIKIATSSPARAKRTRRRRQMKSHKERCQQKLGPEETEAIWIKTAQQDYPSLRDFTINVGARCFVIENHSFDWRGVITIKRQSFSRRPGSSEIEKITSW